MQATDMISLVTNVGFPVTLCFILIKYVMQTVGTKLDKMESSLHTLTEEIRILEEIGDEVRDFAQHANPKSK